MYLFINIEIKHMYTSSVVFQRSDDFFGCRSGGRVGLPAPVHQVTHHLWPMFSINRQSFAF